MAENYGKFCQTQVFQPTTVPSHTIPQANDPCCQSLNPHKKRRILNLEMLKKN